MVLACSYSEGGDVFYGAILEFLFVVIHFKYTNRRKVALLAFVQHATEVKT